MVSPATWLLNAEGEKVLHCGGVKRIAMSLFLLCHFSFFFLLLDNVNKILELFGTEPNRTDLNQTGGISHDNGVNQVTRPLQSYFLAPK